MGKPILFSAPMVRALLAGTKTQTRRLLKLRGHKSFTEFGPSDTRGYDWHFRDAGMRWHDLRDAELKAQLRIGVGDRLYVREAWAKVGDEPDDIHACPDLRTHAYYRADASDPERQAWRPSIYMPRWASRLTLNVTDVRVQRLQEISEDDAIAEGVGLAEPKIGRIGGWRFYTTPPEPGARWSTARDSYLDLFRAINGPTPINPWVAAYTFTVQHGNIDQPGLAS